jgi:hypothetical protein
MRHTTRFAFLASLAAAVLLSGCTAAGMTREQRQFVKRNYKHRKPYMNAVVYCNKLEWTGGHGIAGRPTRFYQYEATEAAIWHSREKKLVLYSKLVYTHDRGRGDIDVCQKRSVKKAPVETK